MAKLTEKMLYQAYLDLYYANQDYESMVDEMTETLKTMKAGAKRTKKLLALAEQQYVEINNSKPQPPKRS